MAQSPPAPRKRAPTFYAIIALKLAKGLLLLLIGLGVYHLSDQNLPDVFRSVVRFLHLDPEKKFFADLAARIAGMSESKMVWLAGGTVLYSLFSLVEGTGMLFRISWAGWLAIGESAFFVPIEIYELLERPFSWVVLVILGLNILIVWYLLRNRRRLFRHHQ